VHSFAFTFLDRIESEIEIVSLGYDSRVLFTTVYWIWKCPPVGRPSYLNKSYSISLYRYIQCLFDWTFKKKGFRSICLCHVKLFLTFQKCPWLPRRTYAWVGWIERMTDKWPSFLTKTPADVPFLILIKRVAVARELVWNFSHAALGVEDCGRRASHELSTHTLMCGHVWRYLCDMSKDNWITCTYILNKQNHSTIKMFKKPGLHHFFFVPSLPNDENILITSSLAANRRNMLNC
jgi:hypothetical protein